MKLYQLIVITKLKYKCHLCNCKAIGKSAQGLKRRPSLYSCPMIDKNEIKKYVGMDKFLPILRISLKGMRVVDYCRDFINHMAA